MLTAVLTLILTFSVTHSLTRNPALSKSKPQEPQMETKPSVITLKASRGRKSSHSQLWPWLVTSTVFAVVVMVGLVFLGMVVGLYHFF